MEIVVQYAGTSLSGMKGEWMSKVTRQLGDEFYQITGYDHNDLNPKNICIDGAGRLRVIDFELSKKRKL
jgi:thiamine kinase-like enzyme